MLLAVVHTAVALALPGRILTFGDSLTAGLIGNTRDQYAPYGSVLAELVGCEQVSRGVVLESAFQMPARLESTQFLEIGDGRIG